MEEFSKNQDRDHLESALKMRDSLQENENLHVQDQLVVNSKDLFEAGFQFPSIAQYDNVQNMLTELQNA